MDSIFLPLVDEVGKFLFANKGNNRTAQNLVKPTALPKGKEDPVQVFLFLLRLADTNEAIRARLGQWFSAVESFAQDEEMRFGNTAFWAKRFNLKREHNLGVKNYALGVSASRTVIISKEKKGKKRKGPTRATE